MKKFFVFTLLSLFLTVFSINTAQAYTLIFKHKGNCSEGKFLIQGNCISVNGNVSPGTGGSGTSGSGTSGSGTGGSGTGGSGTGGSGTGGTPQELQTCNSSCPSPNICLPNGE